MNTAQALPDITRAMPLTSADEPLLSDLREVLTRHNALSRFGITLLHQHFDLSEDEVMVESTDVSARTHTVAPKSRMAFASIPHIETSWRLDTEVLCATQLCPNHDDNSDDDYNDGPMWQDDGDSDSGSDDSGDNESESDD
jgi:hypothetical protein